AQEPFYGTGVGLGKACGRLPRSLRSLATSGTGVGLGKACGRLPRSLRSLATSGTGVGLGKACGRLPRSLRSLATSVRVAHEALVNRADLVLDRIFHPWEN